VSLVCWWRWFQLVVVVVKGHEIKSEGNEGVHGEGNDEVRLRVVKWRVRLN